MTLLREVEQGMDRRALKALRGRFLALNQQRLNRAKQGLSERQQFVLSLLPLLLQVNHPLLPGYVSAATPAGFSSYTPSKEALANAKKLARAFAYKALMPLRKKPLLGLFLMGSLGSLAHAEQSDMDIWLCHEPSLSAQALAELERKCRLLEAWAQSLACEAHFFLINPERFKQALTDAELDHEHCGSTQHYLLLDEFYRTAIWLAGRTPLWWLVPAEHEADYEHYSQTLIKQRFIAEHEHLDLGHLGHIPLGEYVGAGLWQLLKGLESPYKSVLKLLLVETYARQYPNIECLAVRYKAAVYQQPCDLDALDPYIMVYQVIEQDLIARGEWPRLELARRSLYLKADKKLSQTPNRAKSWQRLLLEKLTYAWGWSAEQLAHLDSREVWKAQQVFQEQQALVNEMLYSYRFLADFAHHNHVPNALSGRDLKLLGRRLYAAFEPQAGKIDRFNKGIALDLSEPFLSFAQSTHLATGNNWSLANSPYSHGHPIKKAQSLTELLVWAFANGLYHAHTQLAISANHLMLRESELYRLFGLLKKHFRRTPAAVPDALFLEPSRPQTVLWLVQLEPLAEPALTFNDADELALLSLEQVSLNSWQEFYTQRFDGPDALPEALCALFNSIRPAMHMPTIEVHDYLNNAPSPAIRRVQRLLQTLLSTYQNGRQVRYLLQVAERFYMLHLSPLEVSYLCLADRRALISYLAHSNTQAPALQLDPYALGQDQLGLILAEAKTDWIQVFYQVTDGQAAISILDENNGLWRQTLPFYDTSSLLKPIERFLTAVLFRLSAKPSMHTAAERPLQFYELQQVRGKLTLQPRRPSAYTLSAGFYSVQAQLEPGTGHMPLVTLYCGQQRFSVLDYQGELYYAVARYILAHRRSTERYRCYLTDLDISRLTTSNDNTLVYLHYKSQIEFALNQALESL